MKQNIVVLIIISIFSITLAQTGNLKYSKVKVQFKSVVGVTELAKAGLILDEPYYERNRDGFSYTVVLDKNELSILENSQFSFEILVDDVIEEYNRRKETSLSKIGEIKDIHGLDGFEYGSMGGFYTLDEVIAELDSMRLMYPNLITVKDSIGMSIESRTIWSVKISDNPEIDENEPELLYTSLHHAREPQSMMTVVYFMYYLLENYGTDPEVTYLVDNREFFFVPVVNPDGFAYNIETNPNGGGMWRKNRRDNGDGSFGVDLNRNYGYEWAYDDIGSSSNTSSNTYRGEGPFSEPELQAIKSFCESRNFLLALNYHSYSNVIIYPWGFSDSLTPDSLTFQNYAKEMTKYNGYGFGTGMQTINYTVNGDSDDWMYGEQSTKNKILAMTPEVGNSNDGFWPLQERIYPLAQENVHSNLAVARFAGGFLSIVSNNISEQVYDNGFIDPGEQIKLVMSYQNIGQSSINDVTITFENNESYSVGGTSSFIISSLEKEASGQDSIFLRVADNFPVGTPFDIAFTISQNGITTNDTIKSILVGTPQVLFADNGDSLNFWEAEGSWSLTESSSHSSGSSFTDSPSGNYGSNIDQSLILRKSIELNSDSLVYLEYWTKWHIETEWDFAQVYLSSDSINWTPIKSSNMVKGSGQGVQSSTEYGYHGLQSEWTKETINISDYLEANEVYIKFNIKSDEYVEFDGWYIDDIVVKSFKKKLTNIKNNPKIPIKNYLAQNYPNPFNPSTKINFQIAEDVFVNLAIYNILGQEVETLLNKYMLAGNHSVSFNANNLPGGVYFYKLKSNGFSQVRKMLLIK